MALDPTLAHIPGLGGYYAMRQFNDQQQAGQLQQATQFQALQEHFRGQERDQQMRSGLEALPEDQRTPESIAKIGAKYAPAKDLYHYAQTAIDNREKIKANNETAMARLTQAARIAEQSHVDRMRGYTRQKDRDAEIKRFNDEKLELQRTAQRIAGEKLYFETGTRVPVPGAAPAAAPAAGPMQALPANVPPSDAAAFQAAQAGGVGIVNRQATPEEQAGQKMDMFGPGAGQPAAAPAVPAAPQPSAPMPDAENLDARDLQARAAQPPAPPVAAPVAAPQPPVGVPNTQGTPGVRSAIPEMPLEIARSSPKVKQQWLLQQTKASISGAGQLSPEALTFTAKQYLAGDRQAAQGYARSTTARVALQNAIVEEAGKQGLSPEQTAAKMAEYTGLVAGSRTVGQRAANISLAANEAEEMMSVVRDTSSKFERTSFIPFNMAIKAYDTNTGSPEVKEFGAALNSLINVYARAINPSGVPTINDKEHARALISEVNSPEQVDGVLRILGRELEIAKRAPEAVRASTRAAIAPGAPGAAPAADIGSAVRRAGYAYEPDKYDYRVGIGGQVQRKPK